MNFFEKYNQAFAFAVEKHKDQFRKGTTIPYVVHLYEVSQFLKEETNDEDVIIAGILHDTIEDTQTSIDEIEKLFGGDVANIVASESENKSLPYMERKKLHMSELALADEKTKLVNCADKLSNLRSLYLDQKCFGQDMWKRFNGTKEDICLYYKMAIDALKSLSGRKIYDNLLYYFDLTFNN